MTNSERHELKRWEGAYGTEMGRDYPPPGGWLKYLKDGKRRGTGVWSARYRRYTRSSQWRARRADAIQRSGGQCDLCHGVTLHHEVHHVTYQRAGAEWPEDLRALCVDCHGMIHEARRLPYVEPNPVTKAILRARRNAPAPAPDELPKPVIRRRPKAETQTAPAKTGAVAEMGSGDERPPRFDSSPRLGADLRMRHDTGTGSVHSASSAATRHHTPAR